MRTCTHVFRKKLPETTREFLVEQKEEEEEEEGGGIGDF